VTYKGHSIEPGTDGCYWVRCNYVDQSWLQRRVNTLAEARTLITALFALPAILPAVEWVTRITWAVQP